VSLESMLVLTKDSLYAPGKSARVVGALFVHRSLAPKRGSAMTVELVLLGRQGQRRALIHLDSCRVLWPHLSLGLQEVLPLTNLYTERCATTR
jgi:hypothetical protein